MTEQEYNAAEGVRRSDLWRMSESPEKYKWFLDHPEAETPALVFGSAAHKALLEPESFTDEFVVAPNVDRRTKAGKAEYDAFMTSAGDRTVIGQDDYDTILAMRDKALSIPFVRAVLDGEHELPLFWTDADTGLKCKVKLDALKRNDGNVIIADYKTAKDARTDVFNHAVFRLGYHLQAYMYSEGAMQALGLTERPDFIFIVQEKKAPYSVNIVQVGEDVINAGMDCFREYMGMLKQCTDTGYWWGYNGLYGEPNETYLPGWMSLGEDE